MLKFKKQWKFICLLLTALFLIIPSNASASNLSEKVENVPTNKEWKITFNNPVDKNTVNQNTIYVTNSQNVKQDVTYSINEKIVTVHPPSEGYELGQTYTLHITKAVSGMVNNQNKTLKQAIAKPFKITEGYSVVAIQPNGTSTKVANYETFEQANANLKSNQGIMQNGEYLKIPSGFVSTKVMTVYYGDPTFKKDYGGIAENNELAYVDSNEDYVKVNVAGQEMYVKHGDVKLTPAPNVKSYYSANSTGLYHYVYRPLSGKYDGAYLIGEKPTFMTNGEKYYSMDGINFYDANGKFVGKSYSYFQYMSPRVPTSYTAAQLDQYIASALQERQNSGAARYANATTKSKLKGLGNTLKTIEKEHRVNALFILALAIHESDYGMSCHAQYYNNLFGLNVPDHDDSCSSVVDKNSKKFFTSVEKNINDFISSINSTYFNPLKMDAFQYNGVALGNKMIGMNVRYATDPYWGAKTAGHMYSTDKKLGGKDYKKYQVGITTTEQVSVRTEPIVKNNPSNRAYQYLVYGSIKRLDKMPITISNTPSENLDWYRVISELSTSGTDLYTVVDNVEIVPTH
ncbi:beta-N-acetylglucosaminidase [Ureibacillus xyleni]|uniref:Beta-N-acetylglucosaminidase n=1 Tax=Ureibacillus xyleni TaxID=614648 RepID=A0A285SLW8_9BACL|nr:glucosaminidase domain-containing protein [Ureibacillus xyleni]SOC08756.1 beta-N-acetylglucosaminidase [Ureibacillus xyleni]